MGRKAISRRSFLGVTGRTTVAAIVATVLKVVPEAQGVLAANGIAGSGQISLPGGVEATPLSRRELNRTYDRLIQAPDVQTLVRHLIASGYSERRGRSSAYSFMVSGKPPVVVLLIPFSDSRDAYLIVADFGSTIMVGGGVRYSQSGNEWIDFYDVKNGSLVRQSFNFDDLSSEILPSARSTADPITPQSDASCNICSFVCGFIKGTGCSLGGAVVCAMLAIPCGPIYPECWLICTAIFLIVCYDYPRPCYDICHDAGYCP